MVAEMLKQKPTHRIHYGKGVRFYREIWNYSQEGLATLIKELPQWKEFGMEGRFGQQQISRLEEKEIIEDERVLSLLSVVLKVPVELITNFYPDENAKNVITGNTFHNTHGVIVENQTNSNDPELINLVRQVLEENGRLKGLLKRLLSENKGS